MIKNKMSRTEAAVEMGVSVATVDRMIAKNLIRHVKIGKLVIIDADDVAKKLTPAA